MIGLFLLVEFVQSKFDVEVLIRHVERNLRSVSEIPSILNERNAFFILAIAVVINVSVRTVEIVIASFFIDVLTAKLDRVSDEPRNGGINFIFPSGLLIYE